MIGLEDFFDRGLEDFFDRGNSVSLAEVGTDTGLSGKWMSDVNWN